MKPEEENTSAAKAVAPPGAVPESNTTWGKADKSKDTPAPPPVWTRYIDSRLKQFCAR